MKREKYTQSQISSFEERLYEEILGDSDVDMLNQMFDEIKKRGEEVGYQKAMKEIKANVNNKIVKLRRGIEIQKGFSPELTFVLAAIIEKQEEIIDKLNRNPKLVSKL